MTHPFRPVPVTGMGIVSCLGRGIDPLWKAAEEHRTGAQDGLGKAQSGEALVFANAAIQDAAGEAGWSSFEDVGLILGTTTGQIQIWEKELTLFFQGLHTATDLTPSIKAHALSSILEAIVEQFQIGGPTLLLSSACSASTQAIAMGALWIAQKKVRRCLVGGVETLSTLTIEGFRSLQLLSEEPATPFDRNRKGINLSEGAGFLCLEDRSNHPKAFVSGYGLSSDAYHMTAPHPDGDGLFRAMEAALKRSQLQPSDISWIHAHGTGSPANDMAEGRAISRLFSKNSPPVTSTKGIHGHSLGACGAIESTICIESFRRGQVLSTTGLREPDPEIQITHANAQPASMKHILKNTLGFGGNNAALIFSHPDWTPE